MHQKNALAVLAVLFSSFLFSLKAILVKYSFLHDALLNGETLLALRMAFAIPFFMVMIWLGNNVRSPTTADWLRLFAAGVLGYYLASILDFVGLEYISASLERIILFLYPTLTVIFTAVIYRKPVSVSTFFAILLSYGGTLVVMLAGDADLSLQNHQQSNFYLGSGLVFLAAVCYASYLMLGKPLIQVFGKWRTTGLVMMIASVASLLHFWVVTPEPLVFLSQLQSHSVVYGVLLGIFATVIPASLIIYGIAHIGAAQSALLSAGGPIITLFLAAALLGESLNGWQWLGCVANIVGVLIISLHAKSET